MNLLKYLFSSVLFLITSAIFGQNGFIRGTVYDDATGESLPGVTIFAEGTTMGTMTDFDGKFNLSIPAGSYNLRISFISYETLNMRDVKVSSGNVTLFENLRLKEARIELTEVTITAEAVRNSEVALLTMKQKSANLIDGISASNFRKIGDSDAASSMKRVSGVSVEGGKYVYVRGLGDRYTKTMLNGVDIPGLDPDRNTLQMDLFPTNIIDNIIVHKSFSPELPADFTGGVVDIETKDFPEVKTLNVSLSAGINPDMHFNSDYLTYEGSSTDWLGYDDGKRDIPATTDIPLFSEVVGNPDGAKGQRYQEILRSFDPVMGSFKERSFMDYSIGASAGDQYALKKITLGFNVALSYKSNTEFYEDAEYGKYGMFADPSNYEADTREKQVGNYGVQNVLISGLVGFAIKTQNSKIRINLLKLQNGESKAGEFEFSKSNQGSVFSGIQHNLEYNQRSMTNLLINGKHFFKGWDINWKISPTISSIEDPDVRFTRYEVRDGAYSISTEAGFPERIWRDLKERNLSGVLHVTRDLTVFKEKSKLNFGGGYTFKERDFSILNYSINIRNVPLTGDPNEIFREDNLWPRNGSSNQGTTYEAPFIPFNPNEFNSSNSNIAAYVGWEFKPAKDLRAIVGVRTEKFEQRYTGKNQQQDIELNDKVVMDDLDFFPSANLIYAISEKQNLRASFAMTIARPSFKELSFAEIFDPITTRTFIGGLFRDANDLEGIVYWDGNLRSTYINNYDLRWEYFAEKGEMLSLGAFFKTFDSPIEIVQYFTLTGAFQPRNVGDGQVIGAELEFRKNLDFISNKLSELSVNSNITLTESRIELSATELVSKKENARTGEKVEDYRSMAGQAPLIVNFGIAYNGNENGLEAGVYYNVQGKTLEAVGIVDRPDIYTKSFHSLNLNINKTLGEKKKIQVGLKVENILGDSKESVFDFYNGDEQYFTRLNQGRTFQLRLSYKFF
ncbi:MAG: TonB-dependent receptor [Bacteroidales bacterium]|nr:TonB-dependent receptor [Bacteroidales bacterium]